MTPQFQSSAIVLMQSYIHVLKTPIRNLDREISSASVEYLVSRANIVVIGTGLSRSEECQKMGLTFAETAIRVRRPIIIDGVDSLLGLAKVLNGPIIVSKGIRDEVIFCESGIVEKITVDVPSGVKRCGGQGDMLAGVIAELLIAKNWNVTPPARCELACQIVRTCSKVAYDKHGRSMNASSMLSELQNVLEQFY